MDSIRFSHVDFSYEGKSILQDFSLELPRRGLVYLLGPSGCGKTTLLRLLLGLEKPDSGSIEGLDGLRLSPMFQENRLLPWLSAIQNVALSRPHDLENARLWMQRLGLEGEENRFPAELSGGMKQRLSLARAFHHGGDVLLLDEPLNGLDETLRKQTMEYIHAYARDHLVLMITHYYDPSKDEAAAVFSFSGPPLHLIQT